MTNSSKAFGRLVAASLGLQLIAALIHRSSGSWGEDWPLILISIALLVIALTLDQPRAP